MFPKGYFSIFGALFFERFAYYGLRALLYFVIVRKLALDEEVFSVLNWVITYGPFSLYVLGGFLSDTIFKTKKPILLSCGLVFSGLILFGLCASTSNVFFFYLGLVPFLLGECMFTPQLYSSLIPLFANKDDRRIDGSFLILLLASNAGAIVAPTICGGIGQKFHLGLGLLAASTGVLFAFFILKKMSVVTESDQRFLGAKQAILPISILLICSVLAGSQISVLKAISGPSIYAMVGEGILDFGIPIFLAWIWFKSSEQFSYAKTFVKIRGLVLAAGIGALVIALGFNLFNEPETLPEFLSAPGAILFSLVTILISRLALAFVAKSAAAKYRATAIGVWLTSSMILSKGLSFGLNKIQIETSLVGILLCMVGMFLGISYLRSNKMRGKYSWI